MNQPLISIIVPVYNVEPYLRQCLDSLLAQTYENIEIILVDDGSTDTSGPICDEYAQKYRSITTYHKSNGGLSSARNYGIDRASGDYIGFVDSDDWIKPEMYATLLDDAVKYDADIVMGNVYRYESDEKIWPCQIREKKTTTYVGMDATYRIYTEFSPGDKIYRRALFDDIRYPEGKLYEDARTTYKLALLSQCVVSEPQCLYYYRKRETSIMGTFSPEKYLDRVHVWTEIYEDVKSIFPQSELDFILHRRDKLAIELLKTLIVNKQYFIHKDIVRALAQDLTYKVYSSSDISWKDKAVAFVSKCASKLL